ncbi:isoprene synthase, chloroplastic-like [Durio zibethinus]|uniref:(+)-delta-cadinene synthase n=1 Tax=Durio zibethinus TaxID=66656 RepID=A0A6P5X9I0_DURZI|nr:isoprene synthase, chloroplastic-like [Durio zibethinus]
MAAELLHFPYSCFLTRTLPRDFTPRALHGTAMKLKIRCSVSTQSSQLTPEENRRLANYQPDMWNYDFLQSLTSDEEVEVCEDRAKQLEDKVKSMMCKEAESLEILELIDDVQRLGLGYRFKGEIRRALDRIASLKDETNKSLHATALCFRLLRQHGYQVSQDVFSGFKDQNGSFKANLSEDVKGMLSLYEASYFSIEGENILDEAKEFTTMYLKDPKVNIHKSLAEQVGHALELPLNRRMQRLEARWTIESYSRRQDVNQVVLELAKLDFNRLQFEHQSELRELSRWWRAMGLSKKLSFARDRLMECFFWTLGMVSEPQFSYCRKSLTKVFKLITILDDVYDIYGTVDELEQFTDAVERWDVNIVQDLPDYMKLCFLALYNTVNEMTYDILREGGEVALPYLTKSWVDLLKAFLQEAKWCYNKQIPGVEEYFENGWRSVSGTVLLAHAYILLGHNRTREELEGIEKYHNLLRWSSFIFRLCNDLVSSKAEIERGDISGILCYMHETGMSEESAGKYISNLIDEAWKKLNKDGIGCSPFDEVFVATAFNLARQAHCHYQHADGHGAPDERSRNRVKSLIIEPIPLVGA